MVNVGENNITVYIGDTEISAIYAGDVQIYPNSTAPLTGISLDNLTWVIDVPASGGTATSANCSYTVTGYYDDGRTRNLTSKATITGSLVVPATTIETREYIDDLTLTATVSEFTDSATVGVYQEAYQPCNPLVLVNNLGNTNNQGYTAPSGYYIFDYGITEITPCNYDFRGMKCICARTGFNTTPNAMLGKTDGGDISRYGGCIKTIQNFEADCSTITYISYPFGNDSTSQVSQTLTSCTFTNTEKVTYIRQMFRYCTNLIEVHFGDLTNARSAEAYHFQGCTNLTTVTVDALPAENMTNWYWNVCPLTEQSIINILNALPTASYTITLGTTNLNKLTSAEGQTALANARNKGWTVN